MEQNSLLLGLRCDGGWCIPCGHVEWDESVEEATVREVAEETGLSIEIDHLFCVQSNFHDPDLQTVGVWFLAHRKGGELIAQGDLREAKFFCFSDLPQLKFPTDRNVIKQLEARINVSSDWK